MELIVKTSHGESDAVFKGSPDSPFQEGFQGNGTTPGLWISVSSILEQAIYWCHCDNLPTSQDPGGVDVCWR